MENLKSLVMQLATARRDYDQACAEMDVRLAAFRLDNNREIERVDRARTLRDDIEGEIRARTYTAEERAPAPGLTVKITTKLTYFPKDAVVWAMQNGHENLLAINTRGFEQVAKGLRLDFVIITELPTVTIARDLTEAAAQIGAEMAAEAEVALGAEMLRAARYGPCTEALYGQQDVAGFFDKAAEAV